MKIQHIVVGWVSLCLSMSAVAQSAYVSDAHRFSLSQPSGTTRFQSLGGVNTALGADLSSVSGNPAGLGFYRKSDISITPALTFTNNNSTFINRNLNDGATFFNVPNLGVVFSAAKRDSDKSRWRGSSFGMSYTRMANFRNEVTFQGNPNNANSIAIAFRDKADGINIPAEDLDVADNQIGFNVGGDEALAQLAYKAYLIDVYDGDGFQDVGNYYISYLSTSPKVTIDPNTNSLIEPAFQVLQSGNISTSGNKGQWSFAWGGNWDDKIYMGASVGISSIRYSLRKDFTEIVNKSDRNSLDRLNVKDNLDIQGTGFNATLGLVYRPVEWVRIGWAFTTPTIYSMNETSSTGLNTYFKQASPLSYKTVETEFKYKLITPLRTSVGLAVFLSKYGFISGDVEYLPYKANRLGGKDWGTTAQGINERVAYNTEFSQYYRNVFNYRLGAEFRYEVAYVRAGANYQPDSYQNSVDNLNRDITSISGGIGLKINNFYADLGFVNTKTKGGYTPYVVKDSNVPSVVTKYSTNSIMLTIGSNF